jgi:hypothetical protein
MADSLPPLEMDFASNGAPVVVVEDVEASDLSEALRLAPALGEPNWVRAYSRVVNHFSSGGDFEPIMDPSTFKAKYLAAYEAEDPDEEVGPGVIRLHNFGIPDFAAIHPPMKDGNTLIFFVENMFMGIPYKVTMRDGTQPEYQPVAMVQ